MSHANARLNVHGRRLLVDRVRRQGWAVAHAAKAMGVSRQCAHRWLARFDAEGEAGLVDRSSRPHRSPRRTPAQVEQVVLACRQEHRRGQDWIGPELGVPARTVARILRRHQVPYLRECDPMTGRGDPRLQDHRGAVREGPPRASWSTWTSRRSGESPTAAAGGPTAGPWARPRPRSGPGSATTTSTPSSMTTPGLAYSEVLADEKGATCAAFLASRRGCVRGPRDRAHRSGHDRQPLELHALQRRRRRDRPHSAPGTS